MTRYRQYPQKEGLESRIRDTVLAMEMSMSTAAELNVLPGYAKPDVQTRPQARQSRGHGVHLGHFGYFSVTLIPQIPERVAMQWVEVEPMPPKSKPKEPSPAATLPSPNNLTFWILPFSFVLLQSPVRWRLDKICVVCFVCLFGGSRWKLGGLLQLWILWASTGQRRCASLHWIHDHDKCIQSAIAKEGSYRLV